MKVLVVGYSDIARRRVLPALEGMGLDGIDIATNRGARRGIRADGDVATDLQEEMKSRGLKTPIRVFSGYEEGITRSDADLCYISTVNSAHVSQARIALESGKHTVVDKPITVSRGEAESLVELSRERGVMLSESVVYPHHARASGTLAKLSKMNLRPRHVTAVFCFPPLPEHNFRYSEALGGGAPADLGAYAVTPGRWIFRSRPESMAGWITERRGSMAVGFRLAALYPGGRSFSGYYSMDAEYQNEIRIAGRDFSLHLDRFFTTPANRETTVRIRRRNREDEWRFPPDDAFASYLNRIRTIIAGAMPNQEREENMELERRTIIDDQQTLDMLRSALAENAGLSE